MSEKEKEIRKKEIACLFSNCDAEDLIYIKEYDLFQKEYKCKRCGRRYAITISGNRIILMNRIRR